MNRLSNRESGKFQPRVHTPVQVQFLAINARPRVRAVLDGSRYNGP
jgi:hypothetical protein